MAVRPIDAVQVLHDINLHRRPTPVSEFESGFNDGLNQAMWEITHAPTLPQPNEPLTLEELQEMDGHPVWVKQLKGLSVCDTDWAVVEFRLEPDVKHDKIRVWWPGSEDEDTPSEDDYGKTWLAYRRPPEGEEEEKHVIEITENL